MSSAFLTSVATTGLTSSVAPKKRLILPMSDSLGAATGASIVRSTTIGAGAAGVMPFTAATGLTALMVSSALGMYDVSVGISTIL